MSADRGPGAVAPGQRSLPGLGSCALLSQLFPEGHQHSEGDEGH